MNAFLKPLDLDPARLSNLTISFSKVFTELARDSGDQMLPTPAVLPAGNSSPYDGLLLAIDVGGSHLRVSLFESMGIELDMVFGDQYQVIPEEIKSGTAEGLFDFIGRRIVDVIKFFARTSSFASSKRLPLILPVGITFSFPMM
jgi:hexokinase